MTVPAFWIDTSPEVYQPASEWWHPWYSAVQFSRAVPSLKDWNDWLEINFRYIWKNGSRREQISVPAMLESSGNLFEEQQDLCFAAMSTSDIKKNQITLQGPQNYLEWASGMRSLLMVVGVWHYANTNMAAPAAAADLPAHKKN
ncbi:hypothetical protein SCLCIDRAFT_23909 [Scleroderma citrinum Foug A]|uniref:Uncharacterized protein n=1 Tax=Scleroderma citrinum Foug A TaxID=1036808 RepID=A0A0C3E6T8_9AGAM|nr:hypothetical protein SCLCIDRAFT_23909 [Scleroderma citrinum Foug A]